MARFAHQFGGPSLDGRLIPLTLGEVRRLLARLMIPGRPTDPASPDLDRRLGPFAEHASHMRQREPDDETGLYATAGNPIPTAVVPTANGS